MKRVQNESIREGMKKGLSAKSDRKKNKRAVRNTIDYMHTQGLFIIWAPSSNSVKSLCHSKQRNLRQSCAPHFSPIVGVSKSALGQRHKILGF